MLQVVMPTIAPLTKVQKCKKFGARVVQHGQHIIESKDFAMSSAEFEGMKYINGYDHPDIIAGAGTMGMVRITYMMTALQCPAAHHLY
jgi:threonine dehydratase